MPSVNSRVTGLKSNVAPGRSSGDVDQRAVKSRGLDLLRGHQPLGEVDQPGGGGAGPGHTGGRRHDAPGEDRREPAQDDHVAMQTPRPVSLSNNWLHGAHQGAPTARARRSPTGVDPVQVAFDGRTDTYS